MVFARFGLSFVNSTLHRKPWTGNPGGTSPPSSMLVPTLIKHEPMHHLVGGVTGVPPFWCLWIPTCRSSRTFDLI